MKAQKVAIITLLCIIQSCAKEGSILPCNISFKGSLDESVKSSSYIDMGVRALIYTYGESQILIENITQGIYLVSNGNGSMPSTWPIALYGGVYHFYSISLNDRSYPNIYFDHNFLSAAENGIDYIWASKENHNIKENFLIDLSYKHISTKVNIVVEFPSTFSNIHINYIKFTLPNFSSSSINLKTGEITPASSVFPLSVLEGNGNRRTFIAVPCDAQKQLELSISGNIGGETINNIVYKSHINDQFQAGVFYTINVSIENLVSSSISLSCNEWDYNSNNISY